MKTRTFGTTGRQVPVVGQGSFPLPDIEALRYGISLGMTHIDTAEMYGNGHAEELIGRAIRGVPRESLFLVSKVMPENAGRGDIVRACEQSLKWLGVNELDCYLLHWRGDVDLAETMEGLESLVVSGKTRAIGVSNLDPWDLREASAALRTEKIACNQVLYNLDQRTVEDHELPWAREHGQALVAYTPLGGIPYAGTAYKVLHEIAESHGVKVETVALAFLLRDDHVFVIPKASQRAHLEANAKAGELELSEDEIAAIDYVFPKDIRTGALPMN